MSKPTILTPAEVESAQQQVEIRHMDSNHTPGPWGWFRHGGDRLYLGTPDRGRLIVMDFTRAGMQGAQPRFSVWAGQETGAPRERLGGIMRTAEELPVDTHPDARLIADAPQLFHTIRELRRECGELADKLDVALADDDIAVTLRAMCMSKRLMELAKGEP